MFCNDLFYIRNTNMMPYSYLARKLRISVRRLKDLENHVVEPTEKEIKAFKKYCENERFPIHIDDY